MAASGKNIQDKDGFETWVIRPKTKKKNIAPKKIVQRADSNRSESYGKENVVPTSSAGLGANKNIRTRGDSVLNDLDGINKTKTSNTDSTVVIIQEEYRMLLSLKKKSKETGSEEADINTAIHSAGMA